MKNTILIGLILFTQFTAAQGVYYTCKTKTAFESLKGEKEWTDRFNGKEVKFTLFPTGEMIIFNDGVMHRINHYKTDKLDFQRTVALEESVTLRALISVDKFRIIPNTHPIRYDNKVDGVWSVFAEKDNIVVGEVTQFMKCIGRNVDQEMLNSVFR